MLEDPERGSSWTNALLGIAAHEIHLCGNPRVGEKLAQILRNSDENVAFNALLHDNRYRHNR